MRVANFRRFGVAADAKSLTSDSSQPCQVAFLLTPVDLIPRSFWAGCRTRATTCTACTSTWASRARTARRFSRRPTIAERPRPGSSTPARSCAATSRFPVLRWQAKYEGIYLLGTSIARPLIAKTMPAGGPRSRRRRVRPRRDRQRQRPVPLPIRGRALEPSIKVIAPWRNQEVSRHVSRPHRDDRLLRARRRFPVKASIAKPYSSDENCLHISYEAGKLEDPAVNGVALVEFGMTVSPQAAPDKVEEVTSRLRARRARHNQRPSGSRALAMVQELNTDRRPKWRRPDRHRREPLRRHEEPGRLRSAGHDGPVRGPPGNRAAHDRSRHASPPRPARARGGRDGLLRLLVRAEDWTR